MTDIQGVVPALGRALAARDYTELTPVQLAVIEPELVDADLLVSAQTGSGKTVAFGLALAQSLLDENDSFANAYAPQALIVAPTRELALQVKRELEWLFAETGARVVSCVGGMNMGVERQALGRGAHIVVGTPGRLCDHISRGSLDMKQLKAVVLDEADEMLDLGFREDLEKILEAAPETRRTLMFSATVPRTIASMAKRYQNNAVRVSPPAQEKQHLDIEYQAMSIAPNDRENAIINVLRFFEAQSAIVFCATRATVNHMTARFSNRGFSVVALSGELSQNERSHALQAMRDGRARVCIATDVAARGIDLPNLELVIHADLPKSPEGLLHRSGRTGRAGRKGTSVLIVPGNARKRTERLLQSASIKASWGKPPSVEEILTNDNKRLLEDPKLVEPAGENELAFAQELLALHSPEQIATAFVRLHRGSQSAPEELLDASQASSKPRSISDFKGGTWISLSIGRKDNAEPRRILPILCRAGQLDKNDIGAIRVQQSETFVELTSQAADAFFNRIAPANMLEKDLSVTKLDGMPAALKRNERGGGQGKPRGKPRGDFKRRDDRDGGRGGERKFDGKGKSESRFQRKQRRSSERDFGAPHSSNEDFKKVMPERELARDERKSAPQENAEPKKPKKPKKPKPKKPKKPKRPKLSLKGGDAGLAPRKRKSD